MRRLALLFVVPGAFAYGQSSQPPASSPAAPSEKTIAATANPELVNQLVNELGITPAQAEGAAGTMFGVAKKRLSVQDFARVSSAVPNMDGLLRAAPAATAKSAAMEALTGKTTTGGLAAAGAAAAAADSLSQLGLKPETIARLAPTLVKAVESRGGAEVGALLAGALK